MLYAGLYIQERLHCLIMDDYNMPICADTEDEINMIIDNEELRKHIRIVEITEI